MSRSVSHGPATREPVYSGNRRIPGLHARTKADGSTVYDVALRLGGKVRRHRLTATTKTDAIASFARCKPTTGVGRSTARPRRQLRLTAVVTLRTMATLATLAVRSGSQPFGAVSKIPCKHAGSAH